jgi:hypothetical protein
MKLTAPLLLLALGACTTEQLATQSQPQSLSLPEATDSVTWIPGTHDGGDIWPTAQGIHSAQVLIRKGPDRSDGPTFIAFVVWNGNFVGKIFRVRAGADGANFRAVMSNVTAARTFGVSNFSWSSTGNGGGGDGNPPIPRPHIDGECHFNVEYLNRLKNRAAAIEDLTTDFMNDNAYEGKTVGTVSVP